MPQVFAALPLLLQAAAAGLGGIAGALGLTGAQLFGVALTTGQDGKTTVLRRRGQ